jgi:alkylhydroperoxidase family enzyme
MQSHAAVAAVILGQERGVNGEDLVRCLLEALEHSPLTEEEKALLRFVDKVNHDSPRITADDMQPLYARGWHAEQIYYAITVCALFNFYNRWHDASGVHALSGEAHRQGGKRSASSGYVRK